VKNLLADITFKFSGDVGTVNSNKGYEVSAGVSAYCEKTGQDQSLLTYDTLSLEKG
jgi:hypothetical protein